MQLPDYLLANASRSDDQAFRAWAAYVSQLVEEHAARWSLTLDAPYQPGGQNSWVAPARDAAGQDLVLKVGWQHYEAKDEAEGLRFWAGRGMVQLVESSVQDQTAALLVERCDPGVTLSQSLPEVEQDQVIATLLNQLWEAPVDADRFRPLSEMTNAWADGAEPRLSEVPDRGMVRAGLALLRELPLDAERSALLCTDLHAGNVLSAQRQPWLAIDPKPYVGDPCYDVVQHMLNCPERLHTQPRELAHRMADLAGLDRDRVVAWLFARCVQESRTDVATLLSPV